MSEGNVRWGKMSGERPGGMSYTLFISVIGCQQELPVCLLDLTAAFDTINHDIFLDRLSL